MEREMKTGQSGGCLGRMGVGGMQMVNTRVFHSKALHQLNYMPTKYYLSDSTVQASLSPTSLHCDSDHLWPSVPCSPHLTPTLTEGRLGVMCMSQGRKTTAVQSAEHMRISRIL